MAPKAGLSQSQKLEKCLEYFRQSRTCHTLKDLEQVLPSAASVHKMQVKDLIKELTDENKVKVEKIGSGNWYWAWAGEEAQERKRALAQLEVEKLKLAGSNATLHDRVHTLKQENAIAQADADHQEMVRLIALLDEEVRMLTTERDAWEEGVAGSIEGIQVDAARWRSETAELTDNIYILESHLQAMVSGDKEAMVAIRRESYGAYYVDDEGLPELAGI